MKLRVAQTYQPVEFERALQRHFVSDRVRKEPLDIELLKGLAAVRIKSPTDDIIIPLTNIAYMKVAEE